MFFVFFKCNGYGFRVQGLEFRGLGLGFIGFRVCRIVGLRV